MMEEEKAQRIAQKLEERILEAAKRVLGDGHRLKAHFNENAGRVDIFEVLTVVSGEPVSRGQLALEDARRLAPEAADGMELEVQLHYQGEAATRQRHGSPFLHLPVEWERFTETASRLARDTILREVKK